MKILDKMYKRHRRRIIILINVMIWGTILGFCLTMCNGSHDEPSPKSHDYEFINESNYSVKISLSKSESFTLSPYPHYGRRTVSMPEGEKFSYSPSDKVQCIYDQNWGRYYFKNKVGGKR